MSYIFITSNFLRNTYFFIFNPHEIDNPLKHCINKQDILKSRFLFHNTYAPTEVEKIFKVDNRADKAYYCLSADDISTRARGNEYQSALTLHRIHGGCILLPLFVTTFTLWWDVPYVSIIPIGAESLLFTNKI